MLFLGGLAISGQPSAFSRQLTISTRIVRYPSDLLRSAKAEHDVFLRASFSQDGTADDADFSDCFIRVIRAIRGYSGLVSLVAAAPRWDLCALL
jgi:hypothetical protein